MLMFYDPNLPLHQDNVEIVRRLVEAGADASKPDSAGNSPLHAAAGAGALAVIKLLGEKGLSIGVKNKEGLTALVRR